MKKGGLVGLLPIGGGVALLIVGGLLAYPYTHSRLAGPPSVRLRMAPAQRATALVASVNAITVTGVPQAGTKAPAQAPEPPATASPVSVSVFIPTATSVPRESEPEGVDARPPNRIVIPTLGIDAPVFRVSWCTTEINGRVQAAWEVPDGYAAGWHETSAPLGVVGNTVLNGHNATNGEIFRDLYMLRPGDDIVLYSEQISRTYAVSETLILPEAGQPLEVRLENARYVMPTDDERLTLVTCHPYGSLRNRLIVIAQPDKPNAYSEPEEE